MNIYINTHVHMRRKPEEGADMCHSGVFLKRQSVELCFLPRQHICDL